jgi:Flp pilus assembly secretin CpaC
LYAVVALFLIVATGSLLAQAAGSSAPNPAEPATAARSDATTAPSKEPVKLPTSSERRRAAKLYLASSKLFAAERFEEALSGYEEAARLDPSDSDYPLAAGLARSHAVTALIQAAAKDRVRGDGAAARAALAHGLELEPEDPRLKQHIYELGDDALTKAPWLNRVQSTSTVGREPVLEPAAGVHSFHLRTDQRQIIQQVFKAYGIEASVDSSVQATQARLDVDDVSFDAAARIAGMATGSFYVPLDAHEALVAQDTTALRKQFMSLDYETVYLSGLNSTDMGEMSSLAKTVYNMPLAVAQPGSETMTLRASRSTLDAFNATLSELLEGHSQVLLEIRMIQLAHTSTRNTGVQPPQSISAFNVYSEEQSILNSNQALVQQIISSGLASPGDTLAILGILLASGQVSNSLLTNGVALFGGGLTSSALAPGALTSNFSLNSSDSRELDEMELRLGDGEDATLRSGERYPIQTSSFSNIAASVPNIPGLTGAGASGGLSSLLAQYGGSVPNVPQVQYEDLGLVLKVTPKILRGGDVSLKIDMKIDALAGSVVNGNPVLSNQSYQGVVTVKEGAAVEVVSELDRSESRAISGTPGISEIPGLNDVTSNNLQKNYASLVIMFVPHIIRGVQAAGHSPMIRIERETPAQ